MGGRYLVQCLREDGRSGTLRCASFAAAQAAADLLWPDGETPISEDITDVVTGQQWLRGPSGVWWSALPD